MAVASQQHALLLLFSLSVLLCSDAAADGAVMAKLAASLSPAPSDWTGTDFCSWTGIACDNSNRVTSISLLSKSIAGTLPADLNSLSQLKSLALQGNRLSGALPSLANLTFLEQVFLDRNQFKTIPADFFAGLSNLQSMNLSDNPTLAPWTIPADLTQSSSLNAFSASKASIAGSIPDIFNSFPNLQNLRLSYNNLTGSLPPSFAGSEINSLWINNQMMGLSGTIEVLSSMTQLYHRAGPSTRKNRQLPRAPIFDRSLF
ncbi:receptor-like kinase TMK4 [Diospyros lotus]|uniref:receptor-like kinase TMK4 n=1 Tax=Diospyros lotus TaxID=55363 RepID=UPI00224DF6E3|nr:receptor-like kinase TMK4 [Diospyros lotus]